MWKINLNKYIITLYNLLKSGANLLINYLVFSYTDWCTYISFPKIYGNTFASYTLIKWCIIFFKAYSLLSYGYA